MNEHLPYLIDATGSEATTRLDGEGCPELSEGEFDISSELISVEGMLIWMIQGNLDECDRVRI